MSEDEHQIEAIAEKVATKVVHQLFMVLGVDSSDNSEVLKLQKDLKHLRGWRESMEVIKTRSLQTAAGFVVTAGLGYIFYIFSRH